MKQFQITYVYFTHLSSLFNLSSGMSEIKSNVHKIEYWDSQRLLRKFQESPRDQKTMASSSYVTVLTNVLDCRNHIHKIFSALSGLFLSVMLFFWILQCCYWPLYHVYTSKLIHRLIWKLWCSSNMGHAILEWREDLSWNVRIINLIYKKYWKKSTFSGWIGHERFSNPLTNFKLIWKHFWTHILG